MTINELCSVSEGGAEARINSCRRSSPMLWHSRSLAIPNAPRKRLISEQETLLYSDLYHYISRQDSVSDDLLDLHVGYIADYLTVIIRGNVRLFPKFYITLNTIGCTKKY